MTMWPRLASTFESIAIPSRPGTAGISVGFALTPRDGPPRNASQRRGNSDVPRLEWLSSSNAVDPGRLL
jgi:hypothetical protein